MARKSDLLNQIHLILVEPTTMVPMGHRNYNQRNQRAPLLKLVKPIPRNANTSEIQQQQYHQISSPPRSRSRSPVFKTLVMPSENLLHSSQRHHTHDRNEPPSLAPDSSRHLTFSSTSTPIVVPHPTYKIFGKLKSLESIYILKSTNYEQISILE